MLDLTNTFTARTGRLGSVYPALLEEVIWNGELVLSRIGDTREVLDLRLVLAEPEYCLVARPGMSDEFAYEELTQLLAGRFDGDRLGAIIPRAAELITVPTAYGPRVAEQLDAVALELEENPTSRRAVVYVGRHDDLLLLRSPVQAEARAHEMPCTLAWQFHLREGTLHMSVCMRSWDLVWGLSYDVPSFVAVQLALADHLGAELGVYVHNAGSAHVYDRHWAIETKTRHDPLHVDHLLGGSLQATRANALRAMGVES